MTNEDEMIVRECINEMQDEITSTKRYHEYADNPGWMSTSLLDPTLGTTFKYVKNGPIIKFKDSDRCEKVGIVSSVIFNRLNKEYSFGVFTYEYPIMGDSMIIRKYDVPTSYLPNWNHERFSDE